MGGRGEPGPAYRDGRGFWGNALARAVVDGEPGQRTSVGDREGPLSLVNRRGDVQCGGQASVSAGSKRIREASPTTSSGRHEPGKRKGLPTLIGSPSNFKECYQPTRGRHKARTRA